MSVGLVEASPRITLPPAIAGNLLSGLDSRRRQLGIDVETLCIASGVSSRSYRWWRAGSRGPSRPVLQRLHAALDRLASGSPGREAVDHHLITAVIGGFRAAARVEAPDANALHVALYCANQFAGIKQARLADHQGVSRAAICQTIRRIEDGRDVAAFDDAVRRIAQTISQQEG